MPRAKSTILIGIFLGGFLVLTSLVTQADAEAQPEISTDYIGWKLTIPPQSSIENPKWCRDKNINVAGGGFYANGIQNSVVFSSIPTWAGWITSAYNTDQTNSMELTTYTMCIDNPTGDISLYTADVKKSISPNSESTIIARCNSADDYVLGGGFDSSVGKNSVIYGSFPFGTSDWKVMGHNSDPSKSMDLTAYVVCLENPPGDMSTYSVASTIMISPQTTGEVTALCKSSDEHLASGGFYSGGNEKAVIYLSAPDVGGWKVAAYNSDPSKSMQRLNSHYIGSESTKSRNRSNRSRRGITCMSKT